jgi:hypothetical protein
MKMQKQQQKKKQKVLVKVYSWHDLVRLAVRDLRQQHGIPVDSPDEFHYVGGLDARRNPFIRLDLTPMPGVAKFEP